MSDVRVTIPAAVLGILVGTAASGVLVGLFVSATTALLAWLLLRTLRQERRLSTLEAELETISETLEDR